MDQHQHPFAEFLYAREGNMRVEIEGKTMIVPALYGVWIPPHIPHRILASSNVLLESLYVEADFAAIEHSGSKVVVVSDFVREFIHYATAHVPEMYEPEGEEAQLVRVLVTLLRRLPDAGLSVPRPQSPLLMKVCQKIQKHRVRRTVLKSGHQEVVCQYGHSHVTSKRKPVWHSANGKRVRMLEAVVMLKRNRSVTQVALELGYATPASFTFAFRGMFGVPPTRY